MLKHITVDVVDKDTQVENAVRKILSETCSALHGSVDVKVSTYMCKDGVVHVYRDKVTLLLDIIGAEEVFHALLRVLPRQYVLIRLLERGIPLE